MRFTVLTPVAGPPVTSVYRYAVDAALEVFKAKALGKSSPCGRSPERIVQDGVTAYYETLRMNNVITNMQFLSYVEETVVSYDEKDGGTLFATVKVAVVSLGE